MHEGPVPREPPVQGDERVGAIVGSSCGMGVVERVRAAVGAGVGKMDGARVVSAVGKTSGHV